MKIKKQLLLIAGAQLWMLLWSSNSTAQSTSAPSAPEGQTPEVGISIRTTAYITPDASAPATEKLRDLIENAFEHNPEIKEKARSYDAMRARIPQAKALPDPMLSIGTTGNITPIPPFDIQKGDPSSMRMLSFTQEIPFPGKLSLKGKIASAESETEWWNYEQTRLALAAEVKDAYYELWYLSKAIQTVSKNKELLQKLTKIAEARYSVGRGIQQDVIKAQVEISKLIEQQTMLELRKQAAEARMNSLLYRDPDAHIGTLEEVKPADFNYTLEKLDELALANYPALKAQKRKIDSEQLGIQLARKEYYPDFTAGFTYFNRPGMPDMYGFNIGIKVPLYFWKKQRYGEMEAAASAEMEMKRYESLRSILAYKIRDKYLAATTARKLVNLYGSGIIPQSSLSLESAISGYETGSIDFLTLMDSQVTLRSYQLGYYEQVSNLAKAIAMIEPLVGKELE